MINRSTCIVLAVAGLLCAPGSASAQNAPNAPSLKPIGGAASAKSQIEPSLIVMNSRGASLQGDKLTLNGILPNSIIFADRPVRAAGHALTAHLLEEWNTADGSFAKDPPNATVSVLGKDGTIKDAVLVLKTPKMNGEQLTFNVQVLEGDLAGSEGPASVFIDIIGLPFTPLSFAGVARRTARRAAWYGGAAAAAAYYHPYYHPYYRPPCGYYPLPPCY
jgi:hypothetical protein